jgi:hypothetical protein
MAVDGQRTATAARLFSVAAYKFFFHQLEIHTCLTKCL